MENTKELKTAPGPDVPDKIITEEAAKLETNTANPSMSEENPAAECPCLVVGIGASAGGQAALEQLFTAMPHDCGVSFVVIMHIPPEGPSYLAEMLERYTPMG